MKEISRFSTLFSLLSVLAGAKKGGSDPAGLAAFILGGSWPVSEAWVLETSFFLRGMGSSPIRMNYDHVLHCYYTITIAKIKLTAKPRAVPVSFWKERRTCTCSSAGEKTPKNFAAFASFAPGF